MKKQILIALLAIPIAAFAQVDQITYKGATLRASKSEFSAKLPLYQCADTRCTFNRAECQGSSTGILDKAIFDAYNKRGNECKNGASFGGALVTRGSAMFGESGLSEVDLVVPASQMNQLSESVESKYGAPSSTDATPTRTRAGVEHQNWVKTWNVGIDILILEMRSGRVDEGRVLLATHERMMESEARRKKRIEAGGKDF